MSAGRAFHTATLLNNGKVLVTGSYAPGPVNSLASAELYDPASDTWSAAPSMGVGRAFHKATLLNNGKVLVTGGHTGFLITASAELYDPATNTWSAAPSMSTPRFEATATLLTSGKVLIAGGFGYDGGVRSSAELYDPASNTWSAVSQMSTARERHTATLLNNGKVLVTGGESADATLASVELYDPASNTWSEAPSMSSSRFWHAATRLGNGKVIVTGGRSGSDGVASVDMYDPASNTWSAAPNLSAYRFYHRATLLSNGKVLVSGGYGAASGSYGVEASTELYDSATNTWSMGPSMSSGRTGHTATLLNDGRVLVTGNECCAASAELYDPGVPAATTLTVSAVVHLTFVGLNITLPFSATLTRTSTGAPVVGRTVRFVSGAGPACSATTNAQGVASCTYTLSSLFGVVLGLGYSAVFDGDEGHAASSAHASLVG